jgi:hypothetical protein
MYVETVANQVSIEFVIDILSSIIVHLFESSRVFDPSFMA